MARSSPSSSTSSLSSSILTSSSSLSSWKKLVVVASMLVAMMSSSVVVIVRAGTNDEGVEFLKENKEKEGVVELPSGLQYKILRNGSGVEHPGVSTACSCHYEGKLLDGTKFDSSYDRNEPTTFAPNQVIKGWTEAMQLMVEGDKWELYVPSELGYGDRGSPPKIPGGSVLIFQMEIVKITGAGAVAALKCDVETKDNCNEREVAYIEKIGGAGVSGAWDDAKKKKEYDRLTKMIDENEEEDNIKDELLEWIKRRTHVLKQYVGGDGDEL